MKRTALALAVGMLYSSALLADDLPSANEIPNAYPAGLAPSASARNAPDAPRWDPYASPGAQAYSQAPANQAAAAQPPTATMPFGTPPAVGGAMQPPQQLPPNENMRALDPAAELRTQENQSAAQNQPKSLKSVMKGQPTKSATTNQPGFQTTAPAIAQAPSGGGQLQSGQRTMQQFAVPSAPKSMTTPAASGVNPVRYDDPPAQPARQPFSPNVMQQSAANSTFGAPASGIAGGANRENAASSQAQNRPPVATEPPVDPAKLAASRAAADLLATSLQESTNSAEDGNWNFCTLQQALANISEDRRLATVAAYWRLCRTVSDYRWTLRELKNLEELAPARNSAVEGPMLSTSRAAADARTHEAEVALIRAEEALHSATGTNPSGLSPSSTTAGGASTTQSNIFPSDRPLVGPYNTYYSSLFANRTPVGRTREINRELPVRLQAINVRTAAVQSAVAAVHTAEEAHARGETDMRTVLACHEQLHQQRREFLDAVLQYNLDIAEYAATVANTGMSNDKFVAMLIRTKPPERIGAAPNQSGRGFPAGGRTDAIAPPGNSTQSNGRTGWPAGNSGAADSTRQPAADGWSASAIHTLETERNLDSEVPQPVRGTQAAAAGQQNEPAQRDLGQRYEYNQPPAQTQTGGGETQRQVDPFAQPPAEERYPNHGR
ncbi:MAG TPA: hypothetical protein VGJ15_09945 [Pirellulales bacterium]